jgi:hypothetical protein
VPYRHMAAVRLSRQMKMFYNINSSRFRVALRPFNTLIASVLKALAGLRQPNLLKIGILL